MELSKQNIEKTLGSDSFSIIEKKSGRQSDIYIIEAVFTGNKKERYVVKAFNDSYQANSNEGVKKEYETLEKFYSKINKEEVLCPKPIKFFERSRCYMMGYLPGISLPEYLVKNPKKKRKELAKKLLKGLALYYGAVENIYADLRPMNLIINDNDKVGFLDCTLPEAFHYSLHKGLKYYPYTVDLGFWLHSVMVLIARRIIFRPLLCIRMIKFSRELFREAALLEAADNKAVFYKEIKTVSKKHQEQIKSEKRLKTNILYYIGCFLERIIMHGLGNK